MTEARYGIAQAAADLAAAGLLDSLWLDRGAGLQPCPAAAPVPADAGFRGVAFDTRILAPGEMFVGLPGERFDGRSFAPATVAAGHWALLGTEGGYDARAALAGRPAGPGAGVLLCRDGREALTTLAGCWRGRWAGRLIGITGTNGKTTTKDLCTALLSGAGEVRATYGNFNNELGVPLTLLALRPEHRFAVVEMGASAEGEIARLAALVRPHVGVITNASPAHLARFGSLEGIVRGKGELLDALPADGRAVLNADSPGFAAWRARARCPVVTWGREAGDHRWQWRPDAADGPAVVVDGEVWPVPLPGSHNGANLTAALLACRALGLTDAELRTGLAGFRGSPHRSVLLAWAGRTLLDDTYNANPRSMVAAAQALAQLPGSGRRIAVLGAMAELGPEAPEIHRTTGIELAAGPVDLLVAVGEGARPFQDGFDAAGKPHHYCATITEAAAWIAAETRPGDRLLLKGSRSAAMETIIPLLRDQTAGA